MAKSPEAFRSISEAATEVGVPQHVLRFWETKFAFVAPVKRAGPPKAAAHVEDYAPSAQLTGARWEH